MIEFLKAIKYWGIKLFYILISPAFLIALCLVIYCASFTLFIEFIINNKIDYCNPENKTRWVVDRWRFANFTFGFAYIFLFNRFNIENSIARQFLLVSEIVYLLTLLIITGVYFTLITKPYAYMIIIDFGTAIATIMIVISASKYGFIKD